MSATAWTPALRARWQAIESHAVGGASSIHAFAARLAAEQSLTREQALRAIAEYRRFVFLACVASQQVTPSKAVDAVWHLHLLYTRDYWQTFCPDVLGMPLHHEPGSGDDEALRFREQYADTLTLYRRFFGAPPESVWPRASHLHASPQPQVDAPARNHAMRRVAALAVALAVSALVGAAVRLANPLDWRGPEFLSLYVSLLAAVFVGSFVLRAFLKSRMQPMPRALGTLETAEIAYLAGGAPRVVDTAVAELHRRGVLVWDPAKRQFQRTNRTHRMEAPFASVADAFGKNGGVADAISCATSTVRPVQAGLERRGLWFPEATARRVSLFSAIPGLALASFGAAKIGIGISRDAPVSALVVLTGVAALFSALMFLARPGRTRAGNDELRRLRASSSASSHVPEQLALAVALGGTAILAGTALAAYHEIRAPSSDSSSSDSDSGSDSGGDSGGGSSCGGCGGGGGD